jgi:hypothetical protein
MLIERSSRHNRGIIPALLTLGLCVTVAGCGGGGTSSVIATTANRLNPQAREARRLIHELQAVHQRTSAAAAKGRECAHEAKAAAARSLNAVAEHDRFLAHSAEGIAREWNQCVNEQVVTTSRGNAKQARIEARLEAMTPAELAEAGVGPSR